MRTILAIAASMLVVGCGASEAPVAEPAIRRTEILKQELNGAAQEAVQVRVDFSPGAKFGMHVHPGAEIAYVLEGTLAYRIENRPAVVLGVGDAILIPAGTRHAARNANAGRSSELATYLVEKGKPLVVPVP